MPLCFLPGHSILRFLCNAALQVLRLLFFRGPLFRLLPPAGLSFEQLSVFMLLFLLEYGVLRGFQIPVHLRIPRLLCCPVFLQSGRVLCLDALMFSLHLLLL